MSEREGKGGVSSETIDALDDAPSNAVHTSEVHTNETMDMGGGSETQAVGPSSETFDSLSEPPASRRSRDSRPQPRGVSPLDLRTAILRTGRYEPRALLGRGGMGEVWRVADNVLGRDVALKAIRVERLGLNIAAMEARFREEAQVTSQLQHPAILPIFDLGRLPGGALFYTMQEVVGQELHARIEAVHQASDGGPWRTGASGWTFLRLVDVVRVAADAVGLAHSRGLLHRDLKPRNIVVGDRGEVFVLDWGLAKVLGSNDDTAPAIQSDRSGSERHATRIGQIAGTAGYMAPEQARGELDKLCPATDVYALGGVLFEIITGEQPPSEWGEVAPQLDASAGSGRAAPELVNLVKKAMAEAPADRFSTAAVLARAVGAWLEGARSEERSSRAVRVAEDGVSGAEPEVGRAMVGLLIRALDEQGLPVPTATASLLGGDPVAQEALQRLTDASLLIVSESDTVGSRTVVLGEPSLPTTWPRLREQVGAAGDRHRLVHELHRASQAWDAEGRPTGRLLTGDLLQRVEGWAGGDGPWLGALEVALLRASTQAAQQQRQGRARRVRLLALGAVVLIIAFAVLWLRADRALVESVALRQQSDSASLRARRGQLAALASRAELAAEPHAAVALLLAATDLKGAAKLEGEEQDYEQVVAELRELAASQGRAMRIPAHDAKGWNVQWSPDGTRLATGGADGRGLIIDAETGVVIDSVELGDWVVEVVWTDRGAAWFTNGSGRGALWFDGTWQTLADGKETKLLSVSASDERRLLHEGENLVSRDARGEMLGKPIPLAAEPLRPADRDKTGDQALVLDKEGRLLVVDTTVPAVVHSIGPFPGGLGVLAAPDGRHAVVFSKTQEAWVVDLAAGVVTRALHDEWGKRWVPYYCVITLDSQRLQCGSFARGVLTVVSLEDDAVGFETDDHTGSVWGAAHSPDGRLVASAGETGIVRIRESRTGAVIELLEGSTTDIKWLTWSPDGARLATIAVSGDVVIWTVRTGRYRGVPECDGHGLRGNPWYESVTGPDGVETEWVVGEQRLPKTPGQRPAARVCWWDPSTGEGRWGEELIEFAFRVKGGGVVAVATSLRELLWYPPGVAQEPRREALPAQFRLVKTADRSGDVFATDVEDRVWWRPAHGTWERLELAPFHPRQWSVAPAGDRVVGRVKDTTTTVITEVPSGKRLVTILPGDDRQPNAPLYAIDPRGEMVATADGSGAVQMWDLRDGHALPAPSTIGPKGVAAISWSFDGNWFFMAPRGERVWAWPRDGSGSPAWTGRVTGNVHVSLPTADNPIVALRGTEGATTLVDQQTGRTRHRLPVGFARADTIGTQVLVGSLHAATRTVAVWDVAELPEDPVAVAPTLTNLRVCRDDLRVVPVIPFDAVDGPWAPASACGD
jgi:serine/threonine protein kinase/WD40 repeat protein